MLCNSLMLRYHKATEKSVNHFEKSVILFIHASVLYWVPILCDMTTSSLQKAYNTCNCLQRAVRQLKVVNLGFPNQFLTNLGNA